MATLDVESFEFQFKLRTSPRIVLTSLIFELDFLSTSTNRERFQSSLDFIAFEIEVDFIFSFLFHLSRDRIFRFVLH